MSSGLPTSPQIPLDEESKQLTAFIVPQGKFRLTVSLMGLKPLGDYFGMNTKSLCEGKNEGNLKSVDDTLGGAKDARTLRPKLRNFLETCREQGITLNLDKIKIGRNVEFRGFEIECGIDDESGEYKTHIWPSKIAINKVNTFQPPESKRELQRFLGLVNCFKSWSTKLTAKTTKMREALKKGIHYKLTDEVRKEFEDVKAEIKDSGFLQPYDPERKVYVQTDASKLGLGYVCTKLRGTRGKGERK